MEKHLQTQLANVLSNNLFTQDSLTELDFDELLEYGDQAKEGEFLGKVGHINFTVCFTSTCTLDNYDSGSNDRQGNADSTTVTEIDSVQFFNFDDKELEIDFEIFSPIFSKILNSKI